MNEYIKRKDVISAVCFGCNQEFSDEPCEPDACAIRQALNAVPTVDVVPKSEVEELKKAYANYEETTGLKQVKREVAWEIFEEIEAEITEALKNNYKRRAEYYTKERYKKEDGEFINTVNGKIDALRGIDGFIAELKKKYTEENK